MSAQTVRRSVDGGTEARQPCRPGLGAMLSRGPAGGVAERGMPCPIQARAVLPACARCAIRRVAICAALDDRELRDLEAIMSRRRIAPGQSLVIEGDEGDYAFNIVSGGVKLYKSLADGRTQVTGYLLPGDFLGLPIRGRYLFSAEAVAPAELCQFPREPLKRVFDRHRTLQERILTAVHDDLVAAQEHMLLLGRKTAMERLATFLVRLLHRTERLGGVTEPLQVPIQRSDIADHLGLAIETVSRTFTQLRRDRLIRLERADRVTIMDRGRLEDLAEGT